jgi:hypothetical protein
MIGGGKQLESEYDCFIMAQKTSTEDEVLRPGTEVLSAAAALRMNRKRQPRIVADMMTGLPLLTLGDGVPKLSSEEVEEILADFP